MTDLNAQMSASFSPINKLPEGLKAPHFLARASFGSESSPSTPCLAIFEFGSLVFTPVSFPSSLTLLSAVAGPRSESLPPPVEISLSIPPEPTLTERASAVFQSGSTGGSSGSGRLA